MPDVCSNADEFASLNRLLETRVFSERELTFTFAICRRTSVCRLSVTFVRPTQAIEISAIFLRHLVRWPSMTFL